MISTFDRKLSSSLGFLRANILCIKIYLRPPYDSMTVPDRIVTFDIPMTKQTPGESIRFQEP